MAQIVLKTFGMPTAATQAGIANTKIVLNTFRKNVRAVRESPTISAKRVISILPLSNGIDYCCRDSPL